MRRFILLLFPFIILIFISCNALKYVPEGEALLQRVRIVTVKGSEKSPDLSMYLYQEPNKKFLGLGSIDLGWYNMSGTDSSKWINRKLRLIGDPPVLYDPIQTEKSRMAMHNILVNKGYYEATVDVDVKIKNRKAYVNYLVKPNKPYTIRNYDFAPNKDTISRLIHLDMKSSLVRPGTLLDNQILENERLRLTKSMMRDGYYAMHKEFFNYLVDSTLGDHQADVRLTLSPYLPDTSGMDLSQEELAAFTHPLFQVHNVVFMMDVPMSRIYDVADFDTLTIGLYRAIYRGKPFVSPESLIRNCRIEPGALYDIKTVERTYSRMSSLQIMKYINISFKEVGVDSLGMHQLDCYIVLTPTQNQAISFELEGTNTAGDMGVAGNMNYTHRNFFKGAELFQAKIRGAYEALSTTFASDYTEFGGELSMTLPEFKMPFLNAEFKKNVDANTELTMAFQRMQRPEFQRIIASTGVRFNWLNNNLRQTFDLIDLSYVYMPWIQASFKEKYLDSTNLKYSYEDHFILRSGYSFSYSSIPFGSVNRTYYTLRGSFESAGNTLYALYSLAGIKKTGVEGADKNYKIGNISFAQYLKGELEYARSVVLTSKSRMAYRLGFGLACPFGNSSILPFEKRFFSGGANSVRGWSVRTLGPGSYDSGSSRIDFMNQSGDIKLDLGAEYRSSLVWKFESALFADVGNIWTLRQYDNQPGGQFKIDSFYKQLAASVGTGLRLDLNYFLVRFDLGMKVYDPTLSGGERWRIKHIDNLNDFAFHFAIGYPF